MKRLNKIGLAGIGVTIVVLSKGDHSSISFAMLMLALLIFVWMFFAKRVGA